MILSAVKRRVQEGWPDSDEKSEDIQPYSRRRYKLSTEGGCVLWGNRVVKPMRGRKRVLEMLHESHPGIAPIKSLARGYVWWPGLDKDIEDCVKECTTCQSSRKQPPSVPLNPWTWPGKPWSRVHIDYAGPLEGKMFLLVIDAYSKWVEIHCTNTSTSTATIKLLHKSFCLSRTPGSCRF